MCSLASDLETGNSVYSERNEGVVKKEYLGDSYDIVKRFWAESLRSFGQLYAHSRFVPQEIRGQYTAVTSIPILNASPRTPFGILLDPDTGIPLPTESTQKATSKHAPLRFIVNLNDEFSPKYMICFDQSYHRKHALTREEQRERKRIYLREHDLKSFYYVSHAPFLFVSRDAHVLDMIRAKLSSLGISSPRIEPS